MAGLWLDHCCVKEKNMRPASMVLNALRRLLSTRHHLCPAKEGGVVVFRHDVLGLCLHLPFWRKHTLGLTTFKQIRRLGTSIKAHSYVISLLTLCQTLDQRETSVLGVLQRISKSG